MQEFTILTEDDYISDSLEPLMNNDSTLRSSYAGPDFPVEIVPGLLYYQTETDGEGRVTGNGKLYICVNSNVQNTEDGFKLIANLNIDMATQQDLSQHVLNKTNPHNVTPSQIGTYDKQGIDALIQVLAKSDLSNVALSSYPKFTGATTSKNGTSGLVPEANIADRNNFLRGDGTWQPVKQGYDGFPIGYRMSWDGDVIPEGWVEEKGQILNRADYPDGWQFAVSYGMVVTDVNWINNHLFGKFSSGDGSTTFRMPDRRNKYDLYGDTSIGQYKEPGLPDITFDAKLTSDNGFANGALTRGQFYGRLPCAGGGGYPTLGDYNFKFSASRTSEIYGKSNTVTPPSVITRSIRKMK